MSVAVDQSKAGLGTNVPYILAQSGVPVILPSSGSSNASGQITLTTALPYQPSGTVGLYLPTGVVTAGSQGSGAGVYQVTFSSTTVCQVAGTGIVSANGAYTQTTAADVQLAAPTVPAGAMGNNGALRLFNSWQWPNNANNKITRVSVNAVSGGAIGQANTRTTGTGAQMVSSVRNRGSQALQECTSANSVDPNTAGAPFLTTFDFTVAQPVIFSAQLAVATDYVILEGYGIEVLPAS